MAKIKYYIGDRLVRTSDRTYTHAVMRGDQVIACCGRLDLAEKEASRLRSNAQSNIDFSKKCLDTLRAGKKSFRHTERIGRRSFTDTIVLDEPAEYYVGRIEHWEHQMKSYRVVALDAR